MRWCIIPTLVLVISQQLIIQVLFEGLVGRVWADYPTT
jgi:hypothetical protein